MKRLLFSIAVMAATASLCTDCTEKTPISDKPSITVENGHFTPEIMHQMGKISDIQVSPDGKEILYGISYTSIEQNRSLRHLYIMNADGSSNRKVTDGDKSQSNGRWIGGGKGIAYLEDGQIWVCPSNGGTPRKISNVEGGIMEFKFSPDEEYVMFSSDFKVAKKPVDIYPDLDKSDARTIEGLMYRHWDHFVESVPHTWFAPFDGNVLGEATDILAGEPFELPAEPFSGLEQLSFAPQSHQIAYSCRKLTGRDYAFSTNSDIYIYNMENGCEFNMSEGMMGYDTDPVFSPDDTKVAWLSMERNGYEADKVRIFVGEIVSGERKELTSSFKYNASSPVWTPESDALYFCSEVEGVREIWKVDLEGNLSRITPQHEWYDFDTPAIAGDKLITTNASLLRPSEIVSISLEDGSWKQISHENDDILSQLAGCTVEERWIPTTDGKKMLTWVVYPPDFDASKVYPAIELCLGGPQGTISQGWSTRWNYRLMASQGYIVVLPNRRGTTAFGQEWCEQISGDYCGQNMLDYLSAADAMKAEPYVGKMAAVGASYGGYSVYYLAGIHQNRFSAFIAHAGIFNQESMYMSTEEMWFPDWDNGGCKMPGTYMAGSPWSDNPYAVRHYANSPHKLIRNWNTPILITHGEKDYRVPVEQGMSAFNAAQMMGCPSKMILFPEENHWILKPQNSIHWNREFFEWLDRWCK
ncbi:MAG: S9 family peptidase [Bacteroidales bacterium]|nr:S9 family peptidase [Candidatus Cacconaster merdequi]